MYAHVSYIVRASQSLLAYMVSKCPYVFMPCRSREKCNKSLIKLVKSRWDPCIVTEFHSLQPFRIKEYCLERRVFIPSVFYNELSSTWLKRAVDMEVYNDSNFIWTVSDWFPLFMFYYPFCINRKTSGSDMDLCELSFWSLCIGTEVFVSGCSRPCSEAILEKERKQFILTKGEFWQAYVDQLQADLAHGMVVFVKQFVSKKATEISFLKSNLEK
jgi:hypothetical protein